MERLVSLRDREYGGTISERPQGKSYGCLEYHPEKTLLLSKRMALEDVSTDYSSRGSHTGARH
jgi:hypothetical protein